MSDTWLRFVPEEPSFTPTAAAAELARNLFAEFLPESEKVSAIFTDSIEFIDAGGNWSGVACPHCAKNAEDWWADAVDKSCEGAFQDLLVVTPCCGTQVSLNNLHYGWPVAFACFVLEAEDPDRDLQPDQTEQLTQILGCKLRKVWAHI
ncbi:hypothetical protein ACQ86O_22260 [Serratia sp. L9]|uniref:hypothetical protein n=1 Tax=Serratia sp. L9 TaxID=3423946 RepID=UPI003D66921D